MNLFLFYLEKQRDERDIAFSNIPVHGKLFIYIIKEIKGDVKNQP